MGPNLVAFGLIIAFGATIMFVVAAFKVHVAWGIACLLFYPAQWAFLFMHFSEAWKPWCIRILGVVLYGFGVSMAPNLSPGAIWSSASSYTPNSASARSYLSKSVSKPSDKLKSASPRSFLKRNCDLTGTVRDYTPDPRVGDAVTFTFDVKNVGNRRVPRKSYVVMLYIDDECIFYDDNAPAMRPGVAYTHTLSKGSYFTPKKPGQYTYKLKIAPTNGLVDTNPANNIITGTITVR